MRHRTAAALVVLLAAAALSRGQAPDEPTLPPPQPAARPPMPPVSALAHEVGAAMSSVPEYTGLATAPNAAAPSIDETPEHWWLRTEYLFWWVRRPRAATPLAVNETPGAGSPTVLGPDSGHFSPFSGGRFALGYWIDAERTWGAEVGGFFLPSQSKTLTAASDTSGNPALARPVVFGGEPVLVPVSVPNLLAGALTTRASLALSGVDADLVWNACRGPCWSVDLLAGYRHLDLRESLSVVQASQTLAPVDVPTFGLLPGGTSLLAFDQAATSNHFDGARLGARGEFDCGPCYLRLSGDAAIGANSQTIRTAGTTHVIPAGTADVLVLPGGVSVGANELGHFARSRAAFAGGLGVEAGFIVTTHVRLFAAYSLLYWSEVVRPGDQLGAGGPAPPFRTSDFWAQGVTGGVEVRW